MNKYTLAPVAAISLLLLSACAAMQGAPSSARADMEPTRGSQARGVVQFVQDGDKVKVNGDFGSMIAIMLRATNGIIAPRRFAA